MKILIADSDDNTRKQLAAYIAKCKHEAFEAASNDEALSMVREHPINLIITCQKRLGLDGLELCRSLRKQVGKRYTYIILDVANGKKENRLEGYKAGADAVIGSPYDLDEMQALITTGHRIVSFGHAKAHPLPNPLPEKKEEGKKQKDDPEISKYDRVLAKIALINKILNKKQLAETFSIQSREKKAGRDTPLADIILAREMVTAEVLEDLHIATKRRMGKRFGILVIKNKFATQEQVDNALKIQGEEYKDAKTCRRIGDILVTQGIISEKQRDLIWLEQEDVELLSDAAPPEGEPKQDEQPPASEGSPELGLILSEDLMTATLSLKSEDRDKITIDQVKALLEEKEVQYGILDDSIIEDFLRQTEPGEDSLVVARGKNPIPGKKAAVKYHFDTDFLVAGRISEDGDIDYRERGKRPHVKAGELIAEKTPMEKGSSGMDVRGGKIPAPEVEDIKLKCEGGTELADGGLKVLAKIEGQPNLSKTGSLSVFPELNISGDVDYKTGNVDFEGNINITGSIHDGFQVKGGNLFAKEIMAADIISKGDVVVSGGIIGATIEAEGNVIAKYIENANIKAFGDITVGKEVRDSKIRVSGEFISEAGLVISSYVSAKLGVRSKEIGTDVSEPCKITIGVDDNLRKIVQSYDRKTKKIRKELEDAQEAFETESLAQQKTHTTIAEFAQVQDRAILEQRKLKDTLEKLKKTQNQADAVASAEGDLKIATEKAERADQQLQKLFETQEQMDEKVARQQKEVENLIQIIESISQEKEAVIQWADKEHGNPVVKVRGNLTAGTKISGQNAFLALTETVRNVTLKESKIPETDNDWEISIEK